MNKPAKRYTFVGWLPCGHANLFSADPSIVLEHMQSPTPDQRLREWRELVDAMSYYIRYGEVEIVDQERLAEIELTTCDCNDRRNHR